MRRSARIGAIGCAVLLALSAAAPTLAGSPEGRRATAREAAQLAEAAATDDAALAELRSIAEVDGRPVDLAAATAGIDEAPQRAGRLRSLADALGGAGAAASVGDAAAAREAAAAVLEQRKYQDASLPRPFRGPLQWLGDRLRPVTDALGRVVDEVFEAAEGLPGGRLTMAGIGGVLVGLAAWALGRRRTGAVVAGRAGWRLADPDADPDVLEEEAGQATARGDHGLAVRLRYEAGIVRLARRGRIRLEPSTTAHQVAVQAADPDVEALTATFEAVVYGDRVATAAEASESEAGWRRVHGGVRA